MGKNLFLLAVFTTIGIVLAALAVTKYSVPMTVAFVPVFIVFLLLAGILVWRNRKHGVSHNEVGVKNRPLMWLFVPFAIGAIGALIMALQDGWNAGDTIGTIFFGVFALLIGYEWLRRRRATHSR